MFKNVLPFLAPMLLLTACAPTQGHMDRHLNQKTVPSDILDKGTVLLVKIPYNSKKWVRKTSELMEENYRGRFEVLPYNAKLSEGYQDTKKYRYLITISQGGGVTTTSYHSYAQTASNPQGAQQMTSVRNHLFLTDREKGTTGDTNLEAQNGNAILKYYVQKLSGH